MIAITRTPSSAMNECELTHLQRTPIDLELARSQHANYRKKLEALGCQVIHLPADDRLADCAFVEDTAIVLDDIAVICQPHESRLPELATVTDQLERYRSVVRIEPPARIEGGDVLRVGKKILVGLSSRTSAEGIAQLEMILEPAGFDVIPIAVDGCLHLKTACTALDDQTLLINPDWIDARPLEAFEFISVPADEPFAANTLTIESVTLLPVSRPRTVDLLINQGFNVQTVDISEFEKAEAGLTCLSLIF